MPRIRTIKPEFWSSPGVSKMTPLARLLFIAMWNWADDTGRGTFNPRELMGFAFPHDEEMTVAEFRALCAEVRAHVAVTFYDVDGRHYFEIPSWKRHQSKHAKFEGSKHPSPDEGNYIDPANMQVIEVSAEIRRNSAHSTRKKAEGSREKGIGTGEQGNRGGEQQTSQSTEPIEQDPTPQNLNELAAAHAASQQQEVCSKHPDGNPTGEPCWECGQVKKHNQQHEAEHAAAAKQARRQAINACNLCDNNGIAYNGDTARRCNHKQGPF